MLTYKFRSAEPSNVYLPPPTASTESPIIIHPPEDYDMNSYLPPFIEESPPPPSPPENVEPPQSYLPPESVITFISLLFFSRVFSNFWQYKPESSCYKHVSFSSLDSRQSIFAAAIRRASHRISILKTKTIESLANAESFQCQIESIAHFCE